MHTRSGNHNPVSLSHGNLGAVSDNSKNAYTHELKSKYNYQLMTSREYRNVSEADIDLRVKYAKSMIANFTSTDKKLIKLDKRYTKQTLTAVSEVYYVYLGGKAYGKISIRSQFFKRGNDMYFILRKKVAPNAKKR